MENNDKPTCEENHTKVSETPEEHKEFKVNIETVEGVVDYEKLIKEFGTERIDQELLEKFQRITGKELHPWLRRGIFFTHRSMHQFLDAYEQGEPVFLYTGRGPTSDAMHIGHLIPFMFTKWLQDVFDCPLVIQISDEEKAAFKKLDFNDVYKMGWENSKDIISMGFNPKKTFIFSNRDYRLNCKQYEVFVSNMKMITPMKDLQKIFGLGEYSTIACYDWPFYQSAAAFYQAYPHIFGGKPAYCLVPYAIDQDPYFRLARDIATKMNLMKNCSIMSKFIPPLTGNAGKMSSSNNTTATLFLTDNESVLAEKIHKYSFSGGGGNGTLEDHKKFGGNPEVDIAYQYLKYFEDSDEKLQEIHDSFKKGELSCGDLKNILVKKLSGLLEDIRQKRAKVTDEVVKEFYAYNAMELPVPKEKEKTEQEKKLNEFLDSLGIKHSTKYHGVIITDEDMNNLSLTTQGTICKTLFLKGPKDAYYLFIINHKTVLDIKNLHKRLGIQKVSFGKNDTMTELFKVPKNACSVFGLINEDPEKKQIATVYVSEGIPKDQPVNFYPMRPDATMSISYSDMIKLVEKLGYEIKHVE
jgi:tryptophanyl-tRNA synthetase